MTNQRRKILKQSRGITLIALIITIIVLMILAGISFNALVGENGLLNKALNSKVTTENASVKEKIELAWSARTPKFLDEKTKGIQVSNLSDKKLNKYLEELAIDLNKSIGKQGKIKAIKLNKKENEDDPDIDENTNQYSLVFEDENGNNYIVNIGKSGKVSIAESHIENERITSDVLKNEKYSIIKNTNISDLEWDDVKKINRPDIENTGLIPIKFGENGQIVEISESESDWYNYNTNYDGSSMWANAITKDENGNITGFFVWIPRYEYKITYNNELDKSNGGNIDIIFIPKSKVLPDDGYIIHPSFTDGTSNNFKQGEWDEEISGFWVAKYPAGFQANSITDNNGTLSTNISNSTDTIVRTTQKYLGLDEELGYNANAVDPLGYTSNDYMSYPVFKPLTYAYNRIATGDCFVLGKEVSKGTNFYGLSSSSDSHMMKNSEWGALAYLTHSNYGRHGTQLYINNYYTSTTTPYRAAVTGLYVAETSASATTTLTNAYYTNIGVKGSSTGNITGVYDLSGCMWEYTAGYITNGIDSLKYGGNSSFIAKGVGNADPDGYLTLSTKYATVYPYDTNYDNNFEENIEMERSEINWNVYSSLMDSEDQSYGFGDSILEISSIGKAQNSWNAESSVYPTGNSAFFVRGGAYNNSSRCGIFCFSHYWGKTASHTGGFRVVLIGN